MKTWSSREVTIQIHKQDHCGKYKITKHQQVRWCAFNKNKAKVYLLFRYWWGQDSATHWILQFNKIWNGSTRTRTWGLPTTCFYSQPPKNSFKKIVVRLQEKYWKSGSQDPPRKDENSQQPKQPWLGHKKRNGSRWHLKIETLTRGESVRYLGQTITFRQQETTEIKNRIRAAWATFHKYGQELISKRYMLKHRLQLFDAPITPTICYASGTWAPTKEHERMIQTTQRKMLRLIIQTKNTKRSWNKVNTSEDFDNIDSSCTNDESEDGKSDTSHNDQDSDVSLEIDNDEEIDAAEIKEEEWVEYIERSTIEVVEKMENEKIRCCWKTTQRKMKWRLAMRIATSPSERWLIKTAEWNPELSSKYRTNSSIGRPRKRWEDDINEFLKQIEDETEILTESSNQINKTWINTAKDRGRWALLEENYTMTSEERHENNTRARRNSHNRPARYVNGVRLSDEEVANIT